MQAIAPPLGGTLLLANQSPFRRLRGCRSVRIIEKHTTAMSSRPGPMLLLVERCTACYESGGSMDDELMEYDQATQTRSAEDV